MSNVTGTVPSNPHVQKWVKEVAALCQPDEVFWCDGSEDERERVDPRLPLNAGIS